MARETKIGLIVATSFLGLVGAVVAARLARNEEKSATDPSAIARINPIKNEPKPGATASAKDPKNPPPTTGTEPGRLPILTTGNTQTRNDPMLPVEIQNPKEPPLAMPPSIATPNALDREHEKTMRELEEQKRKLEGVAPLPSLDPKGPPEPPISITSNDNKPGLPPLTSGPPAVKPPSVSPPSDPKLDPLPPVAAPKVSGPTPPPVALVPPPSSGPPTIKITEAPAPGLSPPVPAQLAANSGNPTPPPSLDPKPAVTPPVPPPSSPPVSPPASPPPSSNSPPPIGVEPTNRSATTPPITPPATPPVSQEPKGIDPVPPIGTRPTNSSPPITIPPDPSKGVQVNTFDVERYVTKAEDTSFARISQTFYGTDKYAKALANFNKEYPFGANDLKQDPPRLQAGMPVFCPPVHVLESKYAWAIGDAAPPASGNNGTRPITIGGAEPLSPAVGNPNSMSGPPPGTIPPQTNTVNADNTRNYTVREGGEHVLEIARSVLRSSSRWIEVYRLNPSIRPEYPIPAGTVLRLPAS